LPHPVAGTGVANMTELSEALVSDMLRALTQ